MKKIIDDFLDLRVADFEVFQFFFCARHKKRKDFSPEINSLGICFFPEVVTRYNVKSSTRKMTQADISFDKLSKMFRLMGDDTTEPPWGVPELVGGLCGVEG